MAQQPSLADPVSWHRYFAIESNNRAWHLSIEARDAAQDEEMLSAAHASSWHWEAAGTDLNRMRAKMLLAEVHALLGLGATALAYAEEFRAYFLGRETLDWELAFTHVVYAHAAHAAGATENYRSAYQEAVAALAAIAGEEDRAIVMKTFRQVPAP
jgi:hypothetical protein